MKEVRVNAIKDGTVIDHIPSEYTFKVAEILGIKNAKSVVSVASNLASKTSGLKGIIKVEDFLLKEKDVQKIALIAPQVTLSIVHDYKVISKHKLTLPEEVGDLIRCNNKNCITNYEKIKTRFIIESIEPLRLRCHHCENYIGKSEIELK
ncbi:MAG: aspartate carbamoyltransferase regulatory subunit [archaeon]